MTGDFDSGKVYLNGKAYAARRLQPALASQWPAKVVTGGDVTQDSHPFLSTLTRLQDRTGGLGLYKYSSGDPGNMVWDATCETRYRGQLGRRPKQNAVTLSGFSYTISDTFAGSGNLDANYATTGEAWV